MEPETSTRRGLLGALARAATRHTDERAEVSDILRPGGLQRLLVSDDPSAGPAAGAGPSLAHANLPRRLASCPEREASSGELLDFAHAEGLTQRDDDLRGLAIRSLRLTRVEPAAADAWIVTSDDWVTARDAVLVALVKLQANRIHDRLPAEGWLALFVDASGPAAGFDARHAHGVLLDLPAAIPAGAEPVALAPELVLPRRWHEAVQAIGFDDTEADAYDRLRARTQLLQGVERDDTGGPGTAYHRLLGYPDETTGGMPADCIEALRHWSAADGQRADTEPTANASDEWRLLAQISVGNRRRAYLWIRRADLNAGNLDELCAFIR